MPIWLGFSTIILSRSYCLILQKCSILSSAFYISCSLLATQYAASRICRKLPGRLCCLSWYWDRLRRPLVFEQWQSPTIWVFRIARPALNCIPHSAPSEASLYSVSTGPVLTSYRLVPSPSLLSIWQPHHLLLQALPSFFGLHRWAPSPYCLFWYLVLKSTFILVFVSTSRLLGAIATSFDGGWWRLGWPFSLWHLRFAIHPLPSAKDGQVSTQDVMPYRLLSSSPGTLWAGVF